MADFKYTCTDPDCYQWQAKRTFDIDGVDVDTYWMCQVLKFDDEYVIARGAFVPLDLTDEINKIADCFGYDVSELVGDKDLIAECIFEYFIDDFYENVTQGPVPVYKTAADACQKLDLWMGESHMDMWLKD